MLEIWTRHEGENVHDVAISDDGMVIGGVSTRIGDPNEYWAYFYRSDGSLIGELELDQYSPILSMSGDGSVVAIGGPGYDSLYVLGITLLPVGGELLPSPIISTMMILALIALIPAVVVISSRLPKK